MDAFPFHGGVSCSCGEQLFAAEKSRLFGDQQTLKHIMRVSNPRLHKQYGKVVRYSGLVVWELEREKNVVVGFYTKFAQNPATQSHLLYTGDRLLAEDSPCDLIWGIGYSSDYVSARQPPLWRAFNFLSKTEPCDASFATARHRRRATDFCILRAPRPPLETTSSKWTLLRDSDHAQRTRKQPPLRRDTPTLYQTCHRTTAVTSLL